MKHLAFCQTRIVDDLVGEMWFMVYFILWLIISMLKSILNLTRSFLTFYDLSNFQLFRKEFYFFKHLVGQFLIIYLIVMIMIEFHEFHELKEDLVTFAERECIL
jgi:hypothetical protein